jgi:hypothetical protein
VCKGCSFPLRLNTWALWLTRNLIATNRRIFDDSSIQYTGFYSILVWSRLLCNVPFFDPKHKLVWIGQFANIGTRKPGTSGNTSTIGFISDSKATWNNLNFPDALLAKNVSNTY